MSILNDTRPGIVLNDESVHQFNKLLKNGAIKFHQVYNLDIEPSEHHFIDFTLRYKESTITKQLNKTYYDIETFVPESGDFTDPIKVDYPINAVALYNNIANTVYCLTYLDDLVDTHGLSNDEIIAEVKKQYEELCEKDNVYYVDDIKVEVIILQNEMDLIEKMFQLFRDFNTLTLIGYNSSIFDDPYIFNRASKLFGEDRMKDIASEFKTVEKFGQSSYELPDYVLVDILKLYKPVGQGGGGLGKALPNYKLNTVAKKVLGITKLDLDTGFRETYLKNIVGYLSYNIIDTILTFKLDQKLQFLELQFSLSKYNDSSMGATMSGRSILYSYRNDTMYSSQDKLIRAKRFNREILYEPDLKPIQ
jgi:DNA polymerase elongation subunit (family B)